ncbi:MAG: hypothetical protein AAF962_10185 [Actinomycetota bacterium]
MSDDGPDLLVDVEGAEPPPGGGGRGGGGGGSDEPVDRRIRAAAGVVVVAAVLVVAAGLVLGGPPADDDGVRESPGPADDEVEAEPSDAGQAEVTAARERTTTSQRTVSGGPNGAVSTAESEYQLMVGISTGRPITLDPLTGVVTYHQGDGFVPHVVGSSWVLGLAADGDDQLLALPVDDLGAEPVPVLERRFFFPRLRAEQVNDFAVAEIPEDEERPLVLVDLATLELVEHPLIDVGALDDRRSPVVALDHNAGLFTPPAGGVYRVDGEDVRLLTDGALVGADGERALVVDCDPALVCERRWIDPDGAPLDLVVPDSEPVTGRFVPDTDWFIASGEFLTITDVVTGDVVELARRQAPFDVGWLDAISPDGRWLALPGEARDSIELYDLSSGERYDIDLDEIVLRDALFFLPAER